MQGHLPVPSQPHFPAGLSPVLGYIATREPQPLEDREPAPREWWEIDDDEIDDQDEEQWPNRHTRVIRVTAVVVSISLLVAGLGTVLDIVLAAH